jgi:hypothetical protein
MYVFLLVLGSFIAAAGLGLVASDATVPEHTFDASNLAPGMIAFIGGCILIGLGLVVRALLRVERALGAPVMRPLRPAEAVGSVALAQQSEAAGVPFPLKPKPKSTTPQAVPQFQPAFAQAPPAIPAVVRADTALDGMQTAAQERLDSTPLVEESDVSLLPKPPVRAEEERGEVHPGGGRANGSVHAAAAPRAAASARPAQAKVSIFDALWPKRQRPAADVKAVPAEAAEAPPAPQVPYQAESVEPAPPDKSVAGPQPERTMVSILKSGVVEGMAYTLYSDGSIEAQLPGGTLRFGSITELRNHIEQRG